MNLNMGAHMPSHTNGSTEAVFPHKERAELYPSISMDIKSPRTKVSHHELMQAIVKDDVLFQELKKRMRESGMVTNKGAAVALHCFILESMLPEVGHKVSSIKSTNTKNQSIFWPWFKALEALQQAKKIFKLEKNQRGCTPVTSDSKRKSTFSSLENFRNKKFSQTIISTSTPKILCLNGIPIMNFNDNMHDIKYIHAKEAQKGYSLSFNTLVSRPLTFFTNVNRLSSIKDSLYSARSSEVICEKIMCLQSDTAKGRITQRSSLWTEEAVQDLYEETISRDKRSLCSRKKIEEELQEIEGNIFYQNSESALCKLKIEY
jgi:hypothetical protein